MTRPAACSAFGKPRRHETGGKDRRVPPAPESRSPPQWGAGHPSIGCGHHHDPRHHASVLVLEDVAVIDELAELRERDVEDLRGRCAMTAAPLRDGADAVLVGEDLIRNGGSFRTPASDRNRSTTARFQTITASCMPLFEFM